MIIIVICVQGSIYELKDLTGWESERVLYFGDHPYADLVDLSMNQGWRTGAIIQELEDEVRVPNRRAKLAGFSHGSHR